MEGLSIAFNRMVAFLPQLVGGLVILLVALVVGALASSLLRRVASRFGFDTWLNRHGLLTKENVGGGSKALGTTAFWVIMLVGAAAAARSWQLYVVADGLSYVLAYLPHVFAAVLIFGVAWLAAEWLSTRVSQAEYGPSMLSGAVRAVVLTLGAFMALQELRIAPQLVLIAFSLILGAIAVACALAFGLGARPVAKDLSERWAGTVEEKGKVITSSFQNTPSPSPFQNTSLTGDETPAHH